MPEPGMSKSAGRPAGLVLQRTSWVLGDGPVQCGAPLPNFAGRPGEPGLTPYALPRSPKTTPNLPLPKSPVTNSARYFHLAFPNVFNRFQIPIPISPISACYTNRGGPMQNPRAPGLAVLSLADSGIELKFRRLPSDGRVVDLRGSPQGEPEAGQHPAPVFQFPATETHRAGKGSPMRRRIPVDLHNSLKSSVLWDHDPKIETPPVHASPRARPAAGAFLLPADIPVIAAYKNPPAEIAGSKPRCPLDPSAPHGCAPSPATADGSVNGASEAGCCRPRAPS